MYPSKAELEAIWNSNQFGWVKAFSKKSTNKSRYKVTYIPLVEMTENACSEIVWAKDKRSAQDQADCNLRNKLYELQKNNVISKIQYNVVVTLENE